MSQRVKHHQWLTWIQTWNVFNHKRTKCQPYTTIQSNIKYVQAHFCTVNHEQGICGKKKINGKKNASTFFPHLPSHACWDMLTAAWCWLHQCSLNSAKCSAFSAKGKKGIVQRNKEVKLYILNQTEKHLKHQHKLTIAALLHASLKTGKKKEQCFSPSAMHAFYTNFSTVFLKILFNAG